VGLAVPGQSGLAVALAVGSLTLVPAGAAGAAAAIGRPDLLLMAAVTGLLASVAPSTLELSAWRRLTPGVFGVLLSLEPAIAALASRRSGRTRLGPATGCTAPPAADLLTLKMHKITRHHAFCIRRSAKPL
jgi:hypothetical protein